MNPVPLLLTIALAASAASAPATSAPAVRTPAAPAPANTADHITTSSHVPPRLTVGDRFDVINVVTTEHPSLVTGPLADTLGAFVIFEEKRDTRRRGDVDETTYRLGVASFRPGRQILPPLRYLVAHGARSDTLSGDTVGVTLASVLPADMKDIRGLKPPEAFPNLMLWIVPAIVLLLALLAYLAYRLYRRIRRLAEILPPPLPPWEEALSALERMPWRDWLAEGQVKRFYYALSEILKRYLERRFEFDAAEQTTTELLASLRAQRLPIRDDVARFFARCDLVKYAKTVPPPDEAEREIDLIRDLVVRTKPLPPAPAPTAVPQPVAAGGGS